MHKRGLKLVRGSRRESHLGRANPRPVESRKSSDNPYRNYRIWRPGKDGRGTEQLGVVLQRLGVEVTTPRPTNTTFTSFDEATGSQLGKSQSSRGGFGDDGVVAQKGIDGFRMDDQHDLQGPRVAGCARSHRLKVSIRRPVFPERTAAPRSSLMEMKQKVLSRYDIIAVGETPGVTTRHGRTDLARIRAAEHDFPTSSTWISTRTPTGPNGNGKRWTSTTSKGQ